MRAIPAYYYSAGVAGPTKEIYESACEGFQYLNKIADSFVMTMWMENAFLSRALGIVVLEVLFAQKFTPGLSINWRRVLLAHFTDFPAITYPLCS